MTHKKQFDAAKFRKLVHEQIRDIDVYPLNADGITSYQDDEELVELIGNERLDEKNTLPFIFELGSHSISIVLSSSIYHERSYKELQRGEEELARLTIDFLAGLGNGQIALLRTLNAENGDEIAEEIIYRNRKSGMNEVIRTYEAFFSERTKKTPLETFVLVNTAAIKERGAPTSLANLLINSNQKGAHNRQPFQDLDTPLSFDDAQDILGKRTEDAVNRYFDKKEEKMGGPGFKGMYSKFSRGRYIEVSWIAFCISLFAGIQNNWAPLSLQFLIFSLLAVATSYSVKKKNLGGGWRGFMIGLTYGVAGMSVMAMLEVADRGWLWWIAAIYAAITFIEMIVLDVYWSGKYLMKTQR